MSEEDSIERNDLLAPIERATGVARAHIALVICVAVGVIVFFLIGFISAVNLAVFIAGCYGTFSSLARCTSDGYSFEASEDIHEWLSYWVIFALLGVTESICRVWAPDTRLAYVYYLCKLVLFVWMLIPYTRGNKKIFDLFFMPLVRSARRRGLASGGRRRESSEGPVSPYTAATRAAASSYQQEAVSSSEGSDDEDLVFLNKSPHRDELGRSVMVKEKERTQAETV